MARYDQNMYNWLKRNGYAQKYEHPGIYCIKLDNKIVYIGKSHDMLWRVAQHYVGCKYRSAPKYRILSTAQSNGYPINFDVLYYASSTSYQDITEEIGQKEGEYIRQYMPILNTQIPHADNWHKFDRKPLDERELLNALVPDERIVNQNFGQK